MIERLISESNAIAGIQRAPTEDEIAAYSLFFSLPELTVEAVEALAAAVNCSLPERVELAWYVVRTEHNGNATDIHRKWIDAFPSTALIARAVWIWQQFNRPGAVRLDLGFLHAWYLYSLRMA